MKSWLKNSDKILSKKLLWSILLVSSFLTFILTLIQLYFYYQSDISKLEDDLSRIEEVNLESLAQSIWYLNEKQIDLQLQGVLGIPGVEYVQIQTTEGESFTKGDPKVIDQIHTSKNFPLKFVDNMDGNKEINLGQFKVYASLQSVYDKISFQLLIILVSQGAKTFVISFFILFIIFLLVIKHLEIIASHARNIDKNKLAKKLSLDRSIPFFSNSNEDEIDQLVNSINNMQEVLLKDVHRIEESDHAKSVFLANINHEIRTPLMAVMGFLEQSLDPKSNLPDDAREYIKHAQSAASLMSEIIDDIREINFIDRNNIQINLEQFSLKNVIDNIILVSKNKVGDKNIELKVIINHSSDIKIYSDPQKIKRILLNLISNAIKFTKEGHIEVIVSLKDIEFSGKKQAGVHIEVKDSGIGIKEKDIKNLFNRFYQIDSSYSREIGGTGLGLSIVKDLVKALGGDLGVASEIGVGSNFWFVLPQQLKADQVSQSKEKIQFDATKAKESEDLKGIKILIAEDNPMNQKIISMYIKNQDLNITMVNDGQEAIDIFKNHSDFDIIIMDMQMPVVDGYEATVQIREIEKTENRRKIPIVAFTAHALEKEKEKILGMGCTHILIKPTNKKEFVKMIKQVVYDDLL